MQCVYLVVEEMYDRSGPNGDTLMSWYPKVVCPGTPTGLACAKAWAVKLNNQRAARFRGVVESCYLSNESRYWCEFNPADPLQPSESLVYVVKKVEKVTRLPK